MGRTKKRYLYIAALLMLSLLFAGTFRTMNVKADEAVEIYTYEDLLQLGRNPEGSFKLMADIDCSSQIWTPIDFRGTLDGNNHAILNLKVNGCGATRTSTYDGNMVQYDTYFSGFFNILKNANVSNLKFLGVDVNVDTGNPCFAGSIAGMMENSTISNCMVEGQVKVSTNAKCFGTGGIAGYGYGLIENSDANVTLICIDEDVDYKEEQFMGGAYAAGYIDLVNNHISIKGYDTDHGYVHDGGLVGMYIFYPEDNGQYGTMTGNAVDGFITFYEDNEDRRAYCEAFIGEIMNWNFEKDDFNEDNFYRDELFFDDFYDWDTDTYLVLQPHSCDEPNMESRVVASTETEYGYTEYTCTNCDYSYRTAYTALTTNPQPEPVLTPEEEASKAEPTPAPAKKGINKVLITILAIIAVLVIAFVILLIVRTQQRKKREKLRAMRRAKALEARRTQGENRGRNNNPPKE
ncbi:MAG: hypothetical protein IKF93_01450 [Lachnospiraceae bacterium]|nr:hypothetical protein [Lachnospiraceae bacterium]